jgi:MFS family permease
VVYTFFAVYIGKAFFPVGNEATSLLASVAVFGVGFFTRPLGGVLIGAFADKAGRKPAMLLTVALITFGTLGLAATPSYASIGMAAPIIVLICRLLQGLAIGGEVGPSTSLLIEGAPSHKRGLYASWQTASQGNRGIDRGPVWRARLSQPDRDPTRRLGLARTLSGKPDPDPNRDLHAPQAA